MKSFETFNIYWCITNPKAAWDQDLPTVPPWQGKLYINQSDWGMVWTMQPIKNSFHRVHISESELFHTEEEARGSYIENETARLLMAMEGVREEYRVLQDFKNQNA